MKICDLTQFYSPVSGGVKRYVHEKIAYIAEHRAEDEHVLIIPGAKTECADFGRSRTYSIASPLLSRTSRYRALLNLRAVEEILEREQPDIIESGDPYQMAWKAIACGAALRIPAVGFYHSHFPEAYLRSAAKFLGLSATETVMGLARRYVHKLYNSFAATFVPSAQLAELLREWGVANTHVVPLGVNEKVFSSSPDDAAETRASLSIPPDRCVLLYVGRLAKEKNTLTLFRAFDLLTQRSAERFHLLVVGDGSQRDALRQLEAKTGDVTWMKYCPDSAELAKFYRAANLFVHPGVQETFGLVALESQACGTPVVGIAGTYMDRIILHRQEAWARENSPRALAVAIEKMAAGDVAELGVRAAQSANQSHSWRRVFDRLFCIYQNVCAEYKNTRA
ncbi:MAG: glycosyltransferase [Chthoniobacterales bacterium]